MPLRDEFLTQDIDVLPGNEPISNEPSITDILPDATKVETKDKTVDEEVVATEEEDL
jgi:hypothetical protein